VHFDSCKQEERQSLLHEGSGTAAVNAFVEIVFDNSDGRFSVESTSSTSADEVVLRRTVGHKKDEFFLQRKRATKNEVMGLLEGAGFSKSNPYFIVQQGKVNALCTMSDEERLTLLKEVAGTTVYDEKKAESLAKMEENRSSIEKIDEMLLYIDTRLGELQDEKEELTRYQKLDRERRAVEYTVYDHELRKSRQDLDDLEQARHDEAEKLNKLHEDVRVTHEEIRSLETKKKQNGNVLRRNKTELQSLESKKTKLITTKAKLEVEKKELEEGLKSSEEIEKQSKKELSQIEKEISQAQTKLDEDIQPKYEGAQKELNKLVSQNEEANLTIDSLLAKQNRGRNYSSKEERDTALNAQIDELESNLEDKTTQFTSQSERIETLENTLSREELEFKRKTDEMNKKNSQIVSLSESIEEKTRKRNELAEKRRDGWRFLDEHSEKVAEATDDFRRLQSEIRKLTPRATSMGLEALERIVVEERVQRGYFGPVIENIEAKEEMYQTAIEVSAGNALFHVIVDTDATAAKLMKRLERDRLGRVTFLPLSQLRDNRSIQYPESGSDVTPLLSKCIRYHPRIEVAMKHVFGRKLLARNTEVAHQWSQRCRMDAITLEGDLCSSKGSLTGGFVDAAKNRLKMHSDLKQAKKSLDSLETEQKEVQRKATAVDQNVSAVMGEMQKLEAKRAGINHALTALEDDTSRLEETMLQKRKQLENIKSKSIIDLNNEINLISSQIGRLRNEIGTKLSSSLTTKERKLMAKLKTESNEVLDGIDVARHTLEEISLEREKLRSLLEDNLMRKKKELEEMTSGAKSNRRKGREGNINKEELENLRNELDLTEREFEKLERNLMESRATDEEIKEELNTVTNNLDKLKSRDESYRQKLEDATENGERLLTKRSMVISKREMNIKKIQELGSLPPSSELSQYSQLSVSKLMKKLDSVNNELKKYSHVNKKAYDQYVSFNEQREALTSRKEDLDLGAEKVEELVENLDRKKDEAINRTFRGVSSHFKDVFKELVPNGAGELVMRTALPEDGGKDDSFDPNNPNVSLFQGVGIKVRFSAVGENFLMSQLSGGQKALVALALIFSIQRCDPAPFYLFDELDQALDSTYRASVANLIKKQSTNSENPTQFICSTFRPELVTVSERCFGISHQNKVILFLSN